MRILESAENYLKTIHKLHQEKGNVRSVDIANALHFSKASVSVAMKNLRENGYIQVESSGNIVLLDKGREIAEHVYDRHMTVTKLLQSFGVEEEMAKEDACGIEHILHEETFQNIKNFLEKQGKL